MHIEQKTLTGEKREELKVKLFILLTFIIISGKNETLIKKWDPKNDNI